MENHQSTVMSGLTGAGLAVANNVTGIFNEPLLFAHLRDDMLKALVVGFVGAIGGLIAKAIYSVIAKKIAGWMR
jgi:hypothetical protein